MPTASRDTPAPLVGRIPTWSHGEARSSGVWLEPPFVAPTRGVDMEHDTAVRDWSVPLEVRLGEQRWIALPGESLTIGRDPDASVRINDGQVSRCHATLDPTAQGWLLTDHSRNGVFLDGRRTAALLITAPTAVALGPPVAGVMLTMTPIAGDEAPRTAASTHAARTVVHAVVGTRTTIGRLPENDVVVDDLLVSRHHAVLNCTPGGSYIRDLGSANGTYLNGQRVTQAGVAEGRSHRCRPCAAAPVGEPVGRVPGPGGRRPRGGGSGPHPRWPASAGRRRPRGPSTQPAGHPRAQWFGQVDPARCARGYAARRYGTGPVRRAGPLRRLRRAAAADRAGAAGRHPAPTVEGAAGVVLRGPAALPSGRPS